MRFNYRNREEINTFAPHLKLTMEYNSGRPKLIIPEYGRHIQKMIDHAAGIEDRNERNRCAKSIIDVMGQLNPHLRDVSDFTHKLWDHLFIMSNFELDVDSPYEKPSPEVLKEKPEILEYPKKSVKYRHYGKSIQDLVQKAIDHEEGKDKEDFVSTLLNLMKRTYLMWNNDSVDDGQIIRDLKDMSNNKLQVPENFEFENTSDILSRTNQSNNKPRRKGGGKKNHRRSRKS